MSIFISVLEYGFARNAVRVAGILVVACWICGCETIKPRSAPPLTYPAGTAPKFLVVYYPYLANGGESLARPIPRYRGWTDERMERDVRRFANIGLDQVLLTISSEVSVDRHKLARIRRFVELASYIENAPKIVFMVTSEGAGKPLDREQFGRWIVTSGIRRMPAIYSENGKTLVVIREGVKCSGARHPAVKEISAGEQASSQWYWPSQSTCPAPSPLGASQGTIVFAGGLDVGNATTGKKGDGGGLLRRKGEVLRDGIWAAFSMRAPMIIVSSWNDFSRGEFVEPNDLDNSSASDVLREEIQRVKQH